jgi:hypothetical protein
MDWHTQRGDESRLFCRHDLAFSLDAVWHLLSRLGTCHRTLTGQVGRSLAPTDVSDDTGSTLIEAVGSRLMSSFFPVTTLIELRGGLSNFMRTIKHLYQGIQ